MEDDVARRLATLEAQQADLRLFATAGLWHALDRLYAQASRDLHPACPACGKRRPLSRYPQKVDACVFGGGRLVRLVCKSCDAVFGPLSLLYAPEAMLQADYRLLYAHYSEGDSTEAEIR